MTTFANAFLSHRNYFVPHMRCKSVADINYKALKAKGIKYIIFDKDNTVTLPYERRYADLGVKKSILDDCMDVFGKEHMALLSNSAGSKDDKDYHEASDCEHELKVNFIRHQNKKPAVLDDIMKHFKHCDEECEIAIVGDRVLSDIVMGNKYGFLTIYVEPIDRTRDNFVVKIVRKFEDRLLPLICPKQAPSHSLVSDVSDLIKVK